MRSLAWISIVALAACNKQPASSPGQPPPSPAAQEPAQTGQGEPASPEGPSTVRPRAPSAAQAPAKPVETEPPNAPDQKPAFEGQTRAPLVTANVQFDVQTVAKGFDRPWAVAFLPDGRMLVTEKPGRLRLVATDGKLSEVKGVPKVDARGQGGLLDVILDPQFASNQTIYISYAEPRGKGNGTAVARGKLGSDKLTGLRVIWRMKPDMDSKLHYGSRLVFARDGTLFITTGERFIQPGRMQAQQLSSSFGKIIRINPDGSVPKDNPFVGRKDAQPAIWSYGHRNIQAAALHPETGALWAVEHGARGGDEINVVEKGKDYGWPTISYGIEYAGGKIGDGITQMEGMEQPIYYWDPVIAPSGMAFYTGDMFPAWSGSLFVGGLAPKYVARLTLDGTRVVGEERLLEGRARFRDVRVGPDGALYLVTDDTGELLKLVPKDAQSGGARP
jgi:aldose sugar dehydrogenase